MQVQLEKPIPLVDEVEIEQHQSAFRENVTLI